MKKLNYRFIPLSYGHFFDQRLELRERPFALCVYLSLAARDLKQDGRVYPSEQVICNDTGMSMTTVRKYLHLMEELEWIAIHRQPGSHNHYQLICPVDLYEEEELDPAFHLKRRNRGNRTTAAPYATNGPNYDGVQHRQFFDG